MAVEFGEDGRSEGKTRANKHRAEGRLRMKSVRPEMRDGKRSQNVRGTFAAGATTEWTGIKRPGDNYVILSGFAIDTKGSTRSTMGGKGWISHWLFVMGERKKE